MDITVRQDPKAEIDAIIRAGHYSGSVVWSSKYHLGVYAGDERIGAMQFGVAMNPKSGSRIVAGSRTEHWLELNRMWFVDGHPRNAITQGLSQAFKLLRQLRPQLAWVQSFADSRCARLGVVYQAASFLYCGSHESEFYYLDGEWFHKSLVGRAPVDRRGWGSGPKAARLRAGLARAEKRTFTQYRYIKIIRPWARKRLCLPVLPYPKPDGAFDDIL